MLPHLLAAPLLMLQQGRLENAMGQAWEETRKIALTKSEFEWRNVEVQLPLAEHLVEEELMAKLSDEHLDSLQKIVAAIHLAWLRRTTSGHKVNVSLIRLGNVWLLNIPGEAFIEYQLAAQNFKPDDHVCTAAYEEYGPGIEQVLLTAINQVLE